MKVFNNREDLFDVFLLQVARLIVVHDRPANSRLSSARRQEAGERSGQDHGRGDGEGSTDI